MPRNKYKRNWERVAVVHWLFHWEAPLGAVCVFECLSANLASPRVLPSDNFYVSVSKPWLFVVIQLYWNFKLYCFHFFFQILRFQIGGAAYLWMRLIHGGLRYSVFLKLSVLIVFLNELAHKSGKVSTTAQPDYVWVKSLVFFVFAQAWKQFCRSHF